MIKIKLCTICNEYKNLEDFEKNRNQCKKCRNIKNVNRNKKLKNEDIIMYKCNQMASSAYSRVFCKSREYKKRYRNLEEPYGFLNSKEMSLYLYENFYEDVYNLLQENKIPSVDRINSNIGYTKSNIRIIDFRENTLDGVNKRKRKVKMVDDNKNVFIFDSLAECCRHLGYNDKGTSKIRSFIIKDKKYKIPEGYSFEYIN